MRLIGIALLMILIPSCTSVETRAVCSELKHQEIKPVEKCTISFKFQKCRCQMFNMNNWTSIGAAEDHPLEYCEDISGFRLTDTATEIRPKVKAMARLKDNLCQ